MLVFGSVDRKAYSLVMVIVVIASSLASSLTGMWDQNYNVPKKNNIKNLEIF